MDAIGIAPDNQDLYGTLIGLLLQRGQLPDAQRVLRQLMDRHPDSIVGKIAQVEMLLKDASKPEADRRAEAAKAVAELKKAAPGNTQVQWLDFQLTYAGKMDKLTDKEWQEPLNRAMAALKADPANQAAINMIQALLSLPNRRAQAADIWGKVYEDTQKSLQIARFYADALVASGKTEKAVEVLRPILQANPRDNTVRTVLLNCLDKLKKSDEAIALAEGWLKESQNDQERLAYRQLLLKFYGDAKQFDKAQKLLDDWILLTADSALVLELKQRKIELFGKAGQYDKAIEDGQKWIAEARERS
jgi:predicted Zn-dependent protease